MKKTVVLCVVLLLTSVPGGWGAEPESGFASQLLFRQKTYHVFSSAVNARKGDFAVTGYGVFLSQRIVIKERLPIDLGGGIRHVDIANATSADIPSSLQSKVFSLGVRLPLAFTGRDDIFGGIDLFPGWHTAGDHGMFSSAFRMNGALSCLYRGDHGFMFLVGVMLRPQYDREVIPFAGIRCRLSEKVTLNALSSEPNITYASDDRTSFFIECDPLSDEFEMTAGARKGETFIADELKVGIGAERRFFDAVTLRLTVGGAFSRHYRYRSEEQKVSPDNAFYAGYVLRCAF